jgi:rhodanese-related sulfurtransferase
MIERRTIGDLLEAARGRIDRLTPEQARLEQNAGAVLIDTRCQELRQGSGVVPGSVHHPLSVLYWRLDPTSGYEDGRIADPARRVILMCAHGYSSSLAAATLRDMGFERATDIVGGFEAWAAAGLPVEPLAQAGRVSRIRTRTTPPEAAVSTAITPMAKGMPARSASTPATTAPTAKPRSRQSR